MTLAWWSRAAASSTQGRRHNAGSYHISQCQEWICCSGSVGSQQPPAWSHGMLLTPQVKCYDSVPGTIYDYGALTIDGDEYIPFRNYAGKMVLFVNVATY